MDLYVLSEKIVNKIW